MASITVPANIPADLRPRIRAVCAAIGPNMLQGRWPEGMDPANLTAAQVGQLFELLTREMWREQVQRFEAERAAQAAREQATAAATVDPFG